jgi:tRNA(Ile)-lysidine synthase
MNLADHPLIRAVDAAVGQDVTGIVLGVSGGADSVALLRAVAMLHCSKSQIVVAHLDHQLRRESADDAAWVERLTDSLGLPVCIERQDIAAAADRAGTGLEETARRCRYDFLARVAEDRNCRWVAVAHTADDQAETVLHQLLRGSGLAGLRGMPQQRPLEPSQGRGERILIRPLLNVSRSDVLDFLARLNQQYLIDATNEELAHTRNRIRHELLPLLRQQFNPRVQEALVRLAAQAREAQDLVDELAADLLLSAVSEATPDRVMLNVASLRGARRHLVREALRLLFTRQEWPRRRMGFDAWDRLADLAQTAQAPKSLTLPDGIAARYRRGVLTIERT